MAEATVDTEEFHEVLTCTILRPRDGTSLPVARQRDSGGFKSLVLDPAFYWTPDDGISVRFIKPDPNVLTSSDFTRPAEDVEQIAREWEDIANIRFLFNNARDVQVRVGFFPGSRGYSALGIDC